MSCQEESLFAHHQRRLFFHLPLFQHALPLLCFLAGLYLLAGQTSAVFSSHQLISEKRHFTWDSVFPKCFFFLVFCVGNRGFGLVCPFLWSSVSRNTSVLFLLWIASHACYFILRVQSRRRLSLKRRHAGESKTLDESFKRKRVAWTPRVSVSPQLVKCCVCLREMSHRQTPCTQSRHLIYWLVCFWPLGSLQCNSLTLNTP